jgi:hypothetical protein
MKFGCKIKQLRRGMFRSGDANSFAKSGYHTEFPDPEAEDPYVVSAAVIEKVRELGLQPFVQPKPLDPIEKEDVALIC